MDIYIDIIFAVNSIMNFIIFFLASKILKLNPKLYRMAAGAMLSGVIYCVLLVFLTRYFNFISGIGVLLVGLFVAFGRVSKKQFVMLVFYSHMIAFLIGGATLAVYSYIHTSNFSGVMENFSVGLLIASTIFIFIFLKLGMMYYQNMVLTKKAFYPVKIYKGDYVVELITLVDTGNSLVEPISGSPVMLTEQPLVEELMKKEDVQDKLRVIPYKTVGKEGLLMGFIPDKIEIHKNEDIITVEEVVIGLCDFSLSKRGNYRGLLSPIFFEEAEVF